MAKKDITPADVSRSLNRLEGFIDDLLPNIQSLCERNIEDIWTQLLYWVTDVHNNREGDESINYLGIYDCVDFTLNNKSIDFAKRAFSIEAKVKEIESFVLPYISNQITQKVASDFLWETGRILWQIGELHIEPFIQETSQTGDIPETGENECFSIGDDSSENKIGESLTPDQIKEKIKKIKPFPKAKTDEPIPFGKYYRILTNGEFTQANGVKKEFQVIDAEKCDLDLFCLCVERADISDIIKENRQIARLFMYYVANKFKDSDEYVKAAQKALGLNARLSAVPSNYRADFYNLLGDEFPDSNPNKY